jgi:hypothetical protein
MYNYEDEEQKRLALLGAPLSGIQYRPTEAAPAPVQERPRQPGMAEQIGTQYAMQQGSKQLGKGMTWAGNQIGSQAPAPVQDLSSAAAVDTAGNVMPTAMAPLSEAPMQLGVEGTALAPTEIAQTGLMDASTAGAADATAGATASMAGPLAGGVEYARTGDLKKGVGAGAGAAAGAVAGNAILPGVGGYVGSVIGSQLGSAVGGK